MLLKSLRQVVAFSNIKVALRCSQYVHTALVSHRWSWHLQGRHVHQHSVFWDQRLTTQTSACMYLIRLQKTNPVFHGAIYQLHAWIILIHAINLWCRGLGDANHSGMQYLQKVFKALIRGFEFTLRKENQGLTHLCSIKKTPRFQLHSVLYCIGCTF